MGIALKDSRLWRERLGQELSGTVDLSEVERIPPHCLHQAVGFGGRFSHELCESLSFMQYSLFCETQTFKDTFVFCCNWSAPQGQPTPPPPPLCSIKL